MPRTATAVPLALLLPLLLLLSSCTGGATAQRSSAGSRYLFQAPAELSSRDAITINDRGLDVVQCETGVRDCAYEDIKDDVGECANYDSEYKQPAKLDWVVIVSAIVGFLMTYGIGANDAANSWATTVGSGALPLMWAVLLGGVMEWLGAVGLGYGVAKTIKGTSKPKDPECWACGYCNSEMSLYMVAMMASLFSAAIFLLLITFTAMPVSTTHSIIGATVGAASVGVGWDCLNWKFHGGLGGIVASWVISPVASGLIGLIIYWITHHTIIKPKFGGNPRRNAMIGQPILFTGQTFVIVFLILLKAQPTKKWAYTKMGWVSAIAAGCILLFSALVVNPFVHRRMPNLARRRRRKEEEGAPGGTVISAAAPPPSGPSGGTPPDREASSEVTSFLDDTLTTLSAVPQHAKPHTDTAIDSMAAAADDVVVCDPVDRAAHRADFIAGTAQKSEYEMAGPPFVSEEEEDATFTFRYLLVFTAALESFAHGSNDTANATGPFSAVYTTYTKGIEDCRKAQTPVWIMAVAGFGVFLGVTTFGYRVIRTIGKELTDINYHRGFCIEFASTLTVVVATVLEMPVSTTHCQVGAVVFVGAAAFGMRNVAWGLFGRIVLTWVLTLPLAGAIAAALTAAFRPAIRN